MSLNLLYNGKKTIKKTTFSWLVDKNPIIKREYLNYIQHREAQSGFATVKNVLIWNIKYRLFRYSPQKKFSKLFYPETEWNKNWKNKFLNMQRNALQADIVALDLFGTMLVRPFSDSNERFLLLEKKWGIANFRKLRSRAQQLALCGKKESDRHITLLDIYSILENWCGISAKEGARAEIELEKEICFINPEIKKMYDNLRSAGKTIIFLADTFLSTYDLEEILCQNGMEDYKKIFVSDKGIVRLQDDVENYFGKGKKFFYITCYRKEKFSRVRTVNWNIGYYPPLNSRGNNYRPYDMSSDIKNIYDSICNSWLYSNQKVHSLYYEFGFTCGGILAIGLCQWLNQMAKQYNFEQILFVSRDGDIISKVYQKYFNQIRNEYLLFSRMASEQLIFEDYTEEYMDHVILPELEDGVDSLTIGLLFQHIGIKDIRKYWEKEGFSWDIPVHSLDNEQIRRFVYKYKHEINEIFCDAVNGAKKYFHSIIDSNEKICVFDIGWRGTSIVYLKHLLEKKYKFPVHVTGALLGGGTENYANSFFMDDSILTYAFSKYKNYKIMEEICQSQERILAVELLFSSDTSSLLTYGTNLLGEPIFHFEKENPQAAIIQEIHKGILDYVDWYYNVLGAYANQFRIHSQDAIAPLMTVLRNKKYVTKLTQNSKKSANARHGF